MEQVSQYGWKRRGDQMPTNVRNPYIRFTLRQLIDVIPFLFRYVWFWIKCKWTNRILFINSFQPMTLKPIYGVPIGGIGSGSMGRDFRGGFCKYSLRPGLVENEVVNIPANQFIVTVRHQGSTVYQNVLNCADRRIICSSSRSQELKSWSFNFPADRLHYTGLYPRAWSVFNLPCCGGQKLTLICRQISPVLPNDYRDTCLPAAVFAWTVVNEGTRADDIYEVSITFTFRNGTGRSAADSNSRETVCHCRAFDVPGGDRGQQQEAVDDGGGAGDGVKGITLEHKIDGMRCTYALAANHDQDAHVHITRRCFDPTGDGHDLWNDLWKDGSLEGAGTAVADWCYVKERNELAVALCAKLTVKSSSTARVDTCLSWDMPIVMFGGKKRTYARRYTRWFGRLGDAGPALCAHALHNYPTWEEKITEWQKPVLNHPHLPAWYKSAIFNELYFITDGGSVWFEYKDDWKLDEPHLSAYTIKRMKEYGRFAYLESWEYRMLTTYDVHFYASFALASLWPEVEITVQAEFTDQISNEDHTLVRFHFDGSVAPSKTKYRVPHDLGNPADDPWLKTNAYEMHDTGSWRDLNLKYILTCYRDYLLFDDRDDQRAGLEFLHHVWPTIEKLLEIGQVEWDADDDGMIENSGTCDQTYDAWKMHGTSAYCGGLWLAALKVAVVIARILKVEGRRIWWKKLLIRALAAYDKKLWLGDYYKFDERSRGHKSIMADQLCGYWYLKSCGLIVDGGDERSSSDETLPRENVMKACRKIFQFNVEKFSDGSLGVVNGMFPDGRADDTSMQSSEAWSGVTYAVASLFLQMGMTAEAFQTAGGLYRSVYDEFGMQYQTPEAVYERTNYRALGYMRALGIWSMQWALDRAQQQHNHQQDQNPNQQQQNQENGDHNLEEDPLLEQ